MNNNCRFGNALLCCACAGFFLLRFPFLCAAKRISTLLQLRIILLRQLVALVFRVHLQESTLFYSRREVILFNFAE